MSLLAKQRDLAHLNLVGHSLFLLIKKAREKSSAPEQVSSSLHEGYDGTVIGYEASWAGIYPHPDEK